MENDQVSFQVFPVESDVQKRTIFFRCLECQKHGVKMAVVILAQRQKGCNGFAAITTSPESGFVLCCSCCQRGYFYQKVVVVVVNYKTSLPTQLAPKMCHLWRGFAVSNGDFSLVFSKKLNFTINVLILLMLSSISHIQHSLEIICSIKS